MLVSAFDQLQTLILDGVGMSQFEQTIPTLQFLSFRNSQLKSVHLISGNQLHTLFLDNNELENLEFLKTSTNLYTLSLNNNRISNLHWKYVKNCTQLTHLGVGYNMVQEIPPFVLLQTFCAPGNWIKELSANTFALCACLRNIHLSHNRIQQLHGALSLPQVLLEQISFHHNLLQDVAYEELCCRPTILNLEYNRIRKLSDSNLMNRAKHVMLAGNWIENGVTHCR